MDEKRFRYPRPDRRSAGGNSGGMLAGLPPDVEPLPEREPHALMLWLQDRRIAECDRGPACKGLQIGAAVGALVLTIKRCLFGDARLDAQRASGHASFPRLRRVPFYRRARALQFKRSIGR